MTISVLENQTAFTPTPTARSTTTVTVEATKQCNHVQKASTSTQSFRTATTLKMFQNVLPCLQQLYHPFRHPLHSHRQYPLRQQAPLPRQQALPRQRPERRIGKLRTQTSAQIVEKLTDILPTQTVKSSTSAITTGRVLL